jgi:DNA uptake protein ComE-like DNA-binding protein
MHVAPKVRRPIDTLLAGKSCVTTLSVVFCKQVPAEFRGLVARSLLFSDLVFRAASACGTKHVPPAHSVDLNSATAEQLQQVPEIGPGTAKAIVNFLDRSGPFQKVEDL